MLSNIEFANPSVLYFLLLVIPLTGWYILQVNKSKTAIKTSSLATLNNIPATYKYFLRHFLFVLRIGALSLVIIAMARPQATDRWESSDTLGIDIIMTVDISGSMLARDFKPNRLEAAKEIASEFVIGRQFDRIGLVLFSGESFTQCPLTADHAVLLNLFKETDVELVQQQGTAIGIGLATAVKRIKDSDARSKVIILLTDGENNVGAIDPITAADLAKTFNIRVYTIGIGTNGTAPFPTYNLFGRIIYEDREVKIDEETLKNIADKTGGKYFRATDNDKLREIYSEIDKLEKSKIDVKHFSKKEEKFMVLVWISLFLILTEFILSKTVLRSLP